jgi:hypothetical protein
VPTLDEVRTALLAYEGGYLGGFEGTVDADPELTDPDAARTLISGSLFDGEKMSNAYGGMYFWIPRYSDGRRAEARGYRVRYTTVFEPPETGNFVLRFYGFGETMEQPVGAPAESVQAAISDISADLADVEVLQSDDGNAYLIHLPSRIGMGSSTGRLRSQGGLGLILMNRDFSQPLMRGERWCGSPMIPFDNEDGMTGLHGCINNALDEIIIDDLYPIAATSPSAGRSRAIQIWGLTPWLRPEMITGYFAPTDWRATITFMPPSSGVYTVALKTSLTYDPSAPLAYNATGAQLEAALRASVGLPAASSPQSIRVSPQSAASSYTITWHTQHHEATIVPSAGIITGYESIQLREPYPLTMTPWYHADGNQPLLTDPGYEEGASWFVKVRRRAKTKVAPQTYPRKANGQLDTAAAPILGSQWVETDTGLVNDLDQTFVPTELILPSAFRYTLAQIAANSMGGDQARFERDGHNAAVSAAAGLIYGPMERRGNKVGRGLGWPALGNKAAPYFLPD